MEVAPPEGWPTIPTTLIEKVQRVKFAKQLRPITIANVIEKCFRRCLFLILEDVVPATSMQTQQHAIKGRQATDILHVLRLLQERCNQHGLHYCWIQVDIAQAFGSSSSYARKYALNGLFLIDDTKDVDTTNTHNKNEVKKEKLSKKRFEDALKALQDGKINKAKLKEFDLSPLQVKALELC